MQILCDKPSLLKDALPDDSINVSYSPALDVISPANSLMKTLKGLYVSSKLDLDNDDLLDYIQECAKKLDVVPNCHTCRNYDEFDSFCKEFLDDEGDLILAYDVETSAAPFLSKDYKLAGFSLANTVEDGCYCVLDSIDYQNPDKERCVQRLGDVLREHRVLVFNSQHEYIATNFCVGVNLQKDTQGLDDAYAYALTMKTESFKSDVFKLKLLCHRLLGTDNWAGIIDDYIDLAITIGRDSETGINDVEDGQELTIDIYKTHEEYIEAFDEFYNIISEYGYTRDDAFNFIQILWDTYPTWKDYGTLPYNLIPSKMIMRYGCYDSCYLIELFNFFEDWAAELEDKLQGAINPPNIKKAYKNCVKSQIMSAILTTNGVFVSDKRDKEVEEKTNAEVQKYYDELWKVVSDTSGELYLREFIKKDPKQVEKLEKQYLLPRYLPELIPEGFEFIKTTPTFYSFLCRPKTVEARDKAVNEWELEPDKDGNVKLLQKHLLPYSTLNNGDEYTLLEQVLDEYLKDQTDKAGGKLLDAKDVFKPMSNPGVLMGLLTRDLQDAYFISRVVLFEHGNLPSDKQSFALLEFLDENPLGNFEANPELYVKYAKLVKKDVLHHLSKSYAFKELYEKLVDNGIKSFASPIIAYIYEIFISTGCSVSEPIHSAFDFICKLKTFRKYNRIISTFIKGSSGGYKSQLYVEKSSVDSDHLVLADNYSVVDKDGNRLAKPEDTDRVVFGSWYANCAETGRWQATIHNVPAGSYCKRRFVSRFPGGFILTNDMSQAEVRELAAVSHCEKLLETVRDPNIDIHRQTASLAFNVPYDEVTKDQRKQTKTGIFSIVYGREEQSLAQELFNGDNKAAKRLMDAIFKVYPEVREYLDDAWNDVKRFGYLVTRQGCPIFLNPYTQENKDKGENAVKRTTNNYGIQGGASQGMCTGTLINIQKLLDKYNLRSKICCYIHDSVEIDTAPEEFDIVFRILNYGFNDLATKMFDVPTASDSTLGISMGEELDIKRIEENHYEIEGNLSDVKETIEQFRLSYDVDILEEEEGETKIDNSVDWVFVPRSQLKYDDSYQNYKVEFKLTSKVV